MAQEMRTFKAGGYTFKTNKKWSGLWVSTDQVGGEEDGKNPGFRQTVGTAQAQGEQEVRKAARKYADQWNEEKSWG